jgi:hypothetical protein
MNDSQDFYHVGPQPIDHAIITHEYLTNDLSLPFIYLAAQFRKTSKAFNGSSNPIRQPMSIYARVSRDKEKIARRSERADFVQWIRIIV